MSLERWTLPEGAIQVRGEPRIALAPPVIHEIRQRIAPAVAGVRKRLESTLSTPHTSWRMGMRVGIDLVRTSDVETSVATFGERYLRRVFTDAEVAYANASPDQTSARLAARFAAKEATMKALDLSERGVNWNDIEVVKLPSGAPSIVLHGRAAEAAANVDLSVSLSHEGDYATAVVLTWASAPTTPSGAPSARSPASSRKTQ